MKPSIGRIVHYVGGDGQHCAGIITRVWSDTCVNLSVFVESEKLFVATSVIHDPKATDPNSWHWPEKV